MSILDTQFKKGHTSWNKGLKKSGMSGKKQSALFLKKLSERNKLDNPSKRPEVREKMRLAKLGKKRGPLSDEVKKKISEGNKGKLSPKGEEHYNWKGGITTENRKQRLRFRKIMQSVVFERDAFICQICQQHGGHLQVDHIKSWKDFPELRFDMDNCRTLCMACHYYKTFKKEMPAGTIWGHNLGRRIV